MNSFGKRMEKFLKHRWLTCAAAASLFALAHPAFPQTDWCYQHLQKEEFDKAVEVCSTDLHSGKYAADKDVVASRLFYRGSAYFGKLGRNNYRKAIADLSRVIALLPDDISAYERRGVVYLWSGNYDRAIADFSRCLSARHMVSARLPFYENRGIAYWLKGDSDKAIADFSAAISQAEGLGESSRWSVHNELRSLYEQRGNVYYTTGDYEKAVADYGKVVESGAYRSYTQLHIWLALKKISEERAESYRDELLASTKGDRWPDMVARYYLAFDGVTEKEVLAQAAQDDVSGRKRNFCEAYYFLGESALLRGDRKAAEAFFRKSAQTEYRYRISEKLVATVMLSRLKGEDHRSRAKSRRTRK